MWPFPPRFACGVATLRPSGFQLLDWIVLGAYGAVLVYVGFHYSKRQKSTETYFTANRSMRPAFAGISLFASMLSTISYVAVPGELIQNGPIYMMVYICSLPLIFLIASRILIPWFMRQPITSAYELLEKRLGRGVRLLAATTFILTRLVWMALVLYVMGKVVCTVMEWDKSWIALVTIVIGGVTVLYTLYGGIEGVVIADVIQFFILLAGAMLTVACVTHSMGGVSGWWPRSWMPHWAPEPFFSLDPHIRVTVVGTLVSATIWWVCSSGSDQMAIQRYLMTRDLPSARRAFLNNNIADASVSLMLGMVGFALLGFYRSRAASLPAGLDVARNGDALFPHFIGHFLPAGVSGLIVAGMFAAGMSTLSSGFNSAIAVFWKDLVETLRPGRQVSEAAKLRTAHGIALVIGVVTVALSTAMGSVPGNLIEVSSKTINLFVYPMFGLFFLAMAVRFATPFGAVSGAVYSFATGIIVGYWGSITGRPGISFQWIAPLSLAASIVAGCAFSLLPTRGRSWPALAGFAIAAAAPLALGIAALVRWSHNWYE